MMKIRGYGGNIGSKPHFPGPIVDHHKKGEEEGQENNHSAKRPGEQVCSVKAQPDNGYTERYKSVH